MTTLERRSRSQMWMNRFIAWLIIFVSFFALSFKAYAAEIQMGSNGMLVFEPCELTVAVGESVTFEKAGDYYFQCDPHAGAGMKGVIHVS